MSIAGQFSYAIAVAEQRIASIEDALPLHGESRGWRQKTLRPTMDESQNWIVSEKNRRMNEEA
jgi:hypothetical protein